MNVVVARCDFVCNLWIYIGNSNSTPLPCIFAGLHQPTGVGSEAEVVALIDLRKSVAKRGASTKKLHYTTKMFVKTVVQLVFIGGKSKSINNTALTSFSAILHGFRQGRRRSRSHSLRKKTPGHFCAKNWQPQLRPALLVILKKNTMP